MYQQGKTLDITTYAKIKQLKNVEKTTLLKYPQKVIMKIYHQKRNYK